MKRRGSLSFLTIFTFAVPELLDLILRKIGFLTLCRLTLEKHTFSSLVLEKHTFSSLVLEKHTFSSLVLEKHTF